jgi:hypothetical protein
MGGAASAVSSSIDLATVKQLNQSAGFKFDGDEGLEQKFFVFANQNDDKSVITVRQFHDYVDYLRVMQPEVFERIQQEIELGKKTAEASKAAHVVALRAALEAIEFVDECLTVCVLPALWRYREENMCSVSDDAQLTGEILMRALATTAAESAGRLQAWATTIDHSVSKPVIDIGDWSCLQWEASGMSGVADLEAKTNVAVAEVKEMILEMMEQQTRRIEEQLAAGKRKRFALHLSFIVIL